MGQFRGRCAQCGCTHQSKAFRNYKRGGYSFEREDFVLLDGDRRKLPYASDVNCRVCRRCYQANRNALDARMVTPEKRKLSITSIVTPRSSVKRPSPVELVLPGRSDAARRQGNLVRAQLPESFTIDTVSYIESLVAGGCTAQVDPGVCGGRLNVSEGKSSRYVVEIELICADCRQKTTYTHKQVGRSPRLTFAAPNSRSVTFTQTDVRQVLLTLLAGSTFSQCETMLSSSESVLGRKTFFAIQKRVVREVVGASGDYFSFVKRNLAAQLRKESGIWTAQLNGAWSHPGWKARLHTFQIRDNDSGTLLCSVVLQKSHFFYTKSGPGAETKVDPVYEGNYAATSKSMENEAHMIALNQLRECELLESLTHVAGDGDTGLEATLQSARDTQHIAVAGDPGHAKKNFMKALKAVCGQGRYKGYAYRIPMFWLTCVKRAEVMVEGHGEEEVRARLKEFERLWSYAGRHYSQKECTNKCPCNEFHSLDDEKEDEAAKAAFALVEMLEERLEEDKEQDEEFVIPEILFSDIKGKREGQKRKVRYAEKKYLKLDNSSDKVMYEKLTVLMKLAGSNAGHVLYALNTCASEGANSRRLTFCRKDRFFYCSYEGRSAISALLDNLKREEVYKLLSERLKFVWSEEDNRVLHKLTAQQGTRAWHSKRKRSLKFKTQVVTIRKAKIKLNVEGRAATDEVRKECKDRAKGVYQSPASDAAKRWKDPFKRKRGARSQKELQEAHAKGLALQCGICTKYYLKSHTCGGKNKQKKAAKLSRKRKKRKKAPEVDFNEGRRGGGEQAAPLCIQRWLEEHNANANEQLRWQYSVGDGDCCPRSIAAAIGGDTKAVREIVFAYASHSGLLEEMKDIYKEEEAEALFAALGRDYADVGHHFLREAAQVLDRNIIVVQQDGRNAVARDVTEIATDQSPIYVHYNGRNHYNAFVPVQEEPV